MTLTPEQEYEEVSTSNRRRKIAKFALAGVAVLGVGAALTSAAWTDNVWFGGSASSGTIELSGSTDNVTFQPADTQGASTLVISDFVIGPDSIVTKRVWVQNDGSLPLSFAVQAPIGAGPLFTAGATVTAVSNDADGLLGPGEKASIDVTVSGNPSWTGTTMQGQLSGNNSIVLEVQGTTNA